MSKGKILVDGFLTLPGGALIVSAQEKTSSPERNQVQHSVKYEVEAGLPKDEVGEKRRDYAILEAALNDVASPKNPDILVRDLEKAFGEGDDPIGVFLKKYPTAWGYVWAYPPGYSKDGKWALVVFEGGPNGSHGLDWKYMLTRERNRWLVVWRHCHPRE